MRRFVSCWKSVCAVMFGAALLAPVFAADPGGAPGQGGVGPGQPPNAEEMRRNFEEFRKQASLRQKEQLGCTDDEWKIIEPRIQAVRDARAKASEGRMGMPGMPGGRSGRGGFGPGQAPGQDQGKEQGKGSSRGPGGSNTPREQTEVQKAAVALQTVLDKKDAKPEEIKTALTALRDARKKAQDEVVKAQKSLREVLTQRQEAVLVVQGTLD